MIDMAAESVVKDYRERVDEVQVSAAGIEEGGEDGETLPFDGIGPGGSAFGGGRFSSGVSSFVGHGISSPFPRWLVGGGDGPRWGGLFLRGQVHFPGPFLSRRR
jgi:hypothetical protein